MKFDELDEKMRVYETALDHCVLPEMFMVARIDGRGFTRLTREVHQFKAPFDERFRDMMVSTTEHLMNCGFRVVYGYTQSDEISLLFHLEENAFGRKLRKYDSILAGEASAKFSLDRRGSRRQAEARQGRLRTADEGPIRRFHSPFDRRVGRKRITFSCPAFSCWQNSKQENAGQENVFPATAHLPNSTVGAFREPSSALKNGLSGNVPLISPARITVGNCCLAVM
jgi:hypothetical protein